MPRSSWPMDPGTRSRRRLVFCKNGFGLIGRQFDAVCTASHSKFIWELNEHEADLRSVDWSTRASLLTFRTGIFKAMDEQRVAVVDFFFGFSLVREGRGNAAAFSLTRRSLSLFWRTGALRGLEAGGEQRSISWNAENRRKLPTLQGCIASSEVTRGGGGMADQRQPSVELSAAGEVLCSRFC